MTNTDLQKEWENRVAKFKASGQSTTEWCKAHNLKPHQLRYWLRKLKAEHTVKETQWLSVEVGELKASNNSKALPIRIGKATIEVSPGFDPALLSEVVKTLAAL